MKLKSNLSLKTKCLTVWLLLLILILAAFFRFYQLEQRFSFTFDQEATALAAEKILVERRPVLLGMKTGVGEIYIAPFYFYLFSLPLIFSRMDPIGLAFLASLVGVLTTLAFYLVGRELFDEKIGLLAAFIHAGSFWFSSLDRIAWNPNPLMLTVLVLIFSLKKIYEKKEKWWLVLAGALGFSFSLHFSSLFLPIILVLLFFLKRPAWPAKKTIFLSFLILFFFFSPLIVFDLRHQFVNSRAFWRFFTQGNGFVFQPLEKGKIVFATLAEIVFQKKFWADWLLVFGLFLFGLKKAFKVQPIFARFSLLSFLVILLSYSLFSGQTPPYYFLALLPMAIFLFSFILTITFKKKIILFLLAFVFLGVNLVSFFQVQLSRDSLRAKRQVVEFILKRQQGSPFNLSYTTAPGMGYGFPYLFSFYDQEPTGDLDDPTYTLIIPYDFEGLEPKLILNGVGLNLPKNEQN